MTTRMNLFTKKDFIALYRKLHSDDGMMAVLRRMQEPCGISDYKAKENADMLIQLVAAHENAVNMLSDDALDVLDAFLNDPSTKSCCDRKTLLQQLHFGLKFYEDEELIKKMAQGTSESDLFREYYARRDEDPTFTEAKLEEEIRGMMGNYRISPTAMRKIVRQMEKSQDLRATAAELGEEGMRFKAVAAMDLYLRNQGTMTMEEAVHIACTNVELQAVADGVSQGLITEERARKILAVLCLLCIITVIVLTFQVTELTSLIDYTRANIMSHADHHFLKSLRTEREINLLLRREFILGGCTLSVVGNKVAEWMGQFAAKRTFVRTAEEATTAVAMEAMCNRMESSTKEPVIVQASVWEEQTEAQKQPATLGAR